MAEIRGKSKAGRVTEIVAGLALAFVCAMFLVAIAVAHGRGWSESSFAVLLSIEWALAAFASASGILAGILLALRGFR